MKVLMVTNDLDFFWLQKSRLAKALVRAGNSVSVVGPLKTFSGSNSDRAVREGFEYIPLPLDRSSMSPLRELRTFLKLVSIYRRARPDLVHHFTIKPVIYGSIAARITRVPRVINSVTGLGYVFTSQDFWSGLRRALISLLYRTALRSRRVQVIFENAEDRGQFVSKGLLQSERAHVIRGAGVDLKQFSPAPEPEGEPVVVLAARMLWDKGIGEFVQAVSLLKGRGLRFRAVLAGPLDPANPAHIPEEQLRSWSAEGHVEWIGFQEDMPRVYRDSSIVCLPSYREGLPLSLLEALASGRPIVTTDVTGCREVIVDGLNGFSVPVRTVEPLAEALARLVTNPELRRKMGAGGRKMAEEQFSSESVHRETFSVYEGRACEPA